MHFGQQNCTVCTLSRHCPAEGLLLPIRCPPGYTCASEGISVPDALCKIGYLCLGGVGTALSKRERSCSMLEREGTEFPCDWGVKYENGTLAGLWPHQTMPHYFDTEEGCCNDGDWLAQWMRDIGEAIGQKEIFEVYAEQMLTYHLNQYDQFGAKIENLKVLDGMDVIEWYQ